MILACPERKFLLRARRMRRSLRAWRLTCSRRRRSASSALYLSLHSAFVWLLKSLFCSFLPVQEMAAAERAKRQAQQERDELQDEINNQAAKK